VGAGSERNDSTCNQQSGDHAGTGRSGAGCTTKSSARGRANEAFFAGQRSEAKAAWQKAQPMVTVRGDVQHSQIPWTEDLTLARAIVRGSDGLINPTAFE